MLIPGVTLLTVVGTAVGIVKLFVRMPRPGRLATIRLRGLVRELALGEDMLAICDARLREIKATELRLRERNLSALALRRLPSTRA